MLDAEYSHLQNKITELQNKLTLSDHYKNRLKCDIQDITKPNEVELINSKLIVIDYFINVFFLSLLIYFLHVNN